MSSSLFSTLTTPVIRLSLSACFLTLSGCQLVKIQEYKIDSAVKYRTQDVVSSQQLSVDTTSLLKILDYSAKSCLQNFVACTARIESEQVISPTERYSALSELYLAHAQTLEKTHASKKSGRNCTSL